MADISSSLTKPLDGVSTVALIFLFSFAIERVVKGILFCVAYSGLMDPERQLDEKPEEKVKRYRQRSLALLSFFLSACAAMFILWIFDLHGILNILGLKQEKHWLDFAVTALVLAAGAERLGDVMKTYGAPKAPPDDPPLVVTGTLHFDDSSIQLKANHTTSPKS